MRKQNKYGCIVSEDVCLQHDRPLIFQNFCEDSPDIVDYVRQLRKTDCLRLLKMFELADGDNRHSGELIKQYYEK